MFRKNRESIGVWTDEQILNHISKTDSRPRCRICKFKAVPEDDSNLRWSGTCSYPCNQRWEEKMERMENRWRRL